MLEIVVQLENVVRMEQKSILCKIHTLLLLPQKQPFGQSGPSGIDATLA